MLLVVSDCVFKPVDSVGWTSHFGLAIKALCLRGSNASNQKEVIKKLGNWVFSVEGRSLIPSGPEEVLVCKERTA